MSLLKPAENQTAFLKAGIMGFQGSGKTFTASRIAEGLVKHMKAKDPIVAMFDTEKSSDFLVEYFKAAGVKFIVAKSRAFKDLIAAIQEAESAGAHAFLADSVTHVWVDLLKSYGIKTGTRDFLRKLQPCKAEWAQFTDLFINCKMHFLAIGRAGYQWEHEENEEGKKELVAVGTKFKAEGEFGYESDLLLEMERYEDKKTGRDIHRCWVRKDRWDVLDGKWFDDPTFANFLPVIAKLGGEHFGFDPTRNSAEIFGNVDHSWAEQQKQREIAMEELQATFTKNGLTGRTDAGKKQLVELLESTFGTPSWKAVESKSAAEIRDGIEKIKARFVVAGTPTNGGEKKGEDLPF